MKKGFTLAEVLITLGIIGVVAVLTIPTVMQDYKNKLYVTQLKKVYTDIQNAVETIKNEEHLDKFIDTKAAYKNSNSTKGAQYFLTNYFTSVRGSSCTGNCQNNFTGAGKAVTYESINGDTVNDGLLGSYCIQTKYSAIICMRYNENNKVMTVDVDINGNGEPNITGKDAFVLDIDPSDDSIRDMTSNAAQCNVQYGEYTGIASYSAGCLQSIMENNWTIKY